VGADTAGALARLPEMLTYVMGPILKVYRLELPDEVTAGGALVVMVGPNNPEKPLVRNVVLSNEARADHR
jgi:hypothetical protein